MIDELTIIKIEQRLERIEDALRNLENKLLPKFSLYVCKCGCSSWLNGRCISCGAPQEKTRTKEYVSHNNPFPANHTTQ